MVSGINSLTLLKAPVTVSHLVVPVLESPLSSPLKSVSVEPVTTQSVRASA